MSSNWALSFTHQGELGNITYPLPASESFSVKPGKRFPYPGTAGRTNDNMHKVGAFWRNRRCVAQEVRKWKWSRSVVSHYLGSHGLQPPRFLHPWNFPDKSTGVGCHFLLQGNLPNSGIEPGSPALQADALPSKPPGKGIKAPFRLRSKKVQFMSRYLSNLYIFPNVQLLAAGNQEIFYVLLFLFPNSKAFFPMLNYGCCPY